MTDQHRVLQVRFARHQQPSDRVTCKCKWTAEALPDPKHETIVKAFAAHRSAHHLEGRAESTGDFDWHMTPAHAARLGLPR